jgi:hypothetical protein
MTTKIKRKFWVGRRVHQTQHPDKIRTRRAIHKSCLLFLIRFFCVFAVLLWLRVGVEPQSFRDRQFFDRGLIARIGSFAMNVNQRLVLGFAFDPDTDPRMGNQFKGFAFIASLEPACNRWMATSIPDRASHNRWIRCCRAFSWIRLDTNREAISTITNDTTVKVTIAAMSDAPSRRVG